MDKLLNPDSLVKSQIRYFGSVINHRSNASMASDIMHHTQINPSFYEYLPLALKRELLAKLFSIYMSQEDPSVSQSLLQVKLKVFIQLSLEISDTDRYNGQQNIQLLNRAWEAQKLLASLDTC